MNKKARISIAVVGIILSGFAGWKMLHLPLWGHWPLLFFTSLWFSLFFALQLLLSKDKKLSNKAELFVILSPLLLYLGFPDLPIFPLLFVGFVPLLLVLDRIDQSDIKKKKRTAWRYIYFSLLLWNILSTFWVANTSFVPSFVAFGLNAFFMSIPWVLYFSLRKHLGKVLGPLALLAFWISFEFLHMRWEITWSWLNLGNGLAMYPKFFQWYNISGVLGGSAWILALNLMIYKLIRNYQSTKKISWRKVGSAIFVVAHVLIISLVMFYKYEEKGEPVNVTVIQPNFEPHYEKFNIDRNTQFKRFIQLSSNSISDSTDYLVFPETSFNRVDLSSLRINKYIRRLREFLSDYPDLALVTGLDSYTVLEEGSDGPTVRTSVRSNGDTLFWETHNTAVQLQAEGEISVYYKSKLVPGAEIFPYQKFLPFVAPLIKKLGGPSGKWVTQEERSVFSKDDVNVAPVICYESIFGEYCGEYVKKGANLIFIVTNDGWWDNTAGHRQHLYFASLRAVEQRRSIARSANTGISCFINQRGEILQPTEYGEEAAINATILANDEPTIYNKYGDMVGRIALLLSLICLGTGITRSVSKTVN
jgi:apolipoprotein N-acyltransferase